MTVTILPGSLDGELAVEVAFGADLQANPSTWQWTEVTTDVRLDPGISLRHGRSDEASSTQPAECTLTLDNTSGDYSLGGQSPRWPHIRQGAPVRVRVALPGSAGGDGELVTNPPQHVGSYQVADWAGFTNPKTISNVSVAIGDLIVVHAATYHHTGTDDVFADPPTVIGGDVDTWTEAGQVMAAQFNATKSWTAEVATLTSGTGSGLLAFELAHTAGVHKWGFVVEIWRDHDGVGATDAANSTSGTPALTLPGVAARSAVSLFTGDWNADPGTVTYRTGDAGAFVEFTHPIDPEIVVTQGRYPDVGDAGTKTVGTTTPSGQRWAAVAVEVRGRQTVVVTGEDTLYFGYAVSWQPAWDMTGRIPIVALTAAGVLRRIDQADRPVISAMRRRLTTEPGILAYWPMEEGSDSARFASALPGAPPMAVIVGNPDKAAFEGFACSAPVANLNNSTLAGYIPDRPATGQFQARMLLSIPNGGLDDNDGDGARLFAIYLSNPSLYLLTAETGVEGRLRIRGLRQNGATAFDTGNILFNLIDETVGRLFLEAYQDGSAIEITMGYQHLGIPAAGVFRVTLPSATLGKPTRVVVGGDPVQGSVAVGHVVVQDHITSVFDDYAELSAFRGEPTTTDPGRLHRLVAENDVRLDILDGAADPQVLPTDLMGPQWVDQLAALLRDVETVDQGILFDGLHPGLTYFTRRRRENADPVLTLDPGDLAAPLAPVGDDQNVLNRASASRPNGGEAVYEDTDGPLGSAVIGAYDGSATVPCENDRALPFYAGWMVHTGTVEGYRYPDLVLNLAESPHLAAQWRRVTPGARVAVTDPAAVAVGHPAGALDLEVQGYSQTITSHQWTIEINCGPGQPWSVATYAGEDPATDAAWTARLETSGSVLASAASQGATELLVDTDDPDSVWTTASDDLPLWIEVGGIPVEVTAIGAGMPQAFTVTASTVTKPLPSGLSVRLYRPGVLGL